MTRLAILLPVGILTSTVLLSAQAPTQQPPPDRPTTTTPQPSPSEPRATTSAEAKANQITVSGCLKPGTTAGSYVLADALTPTVPGNASAAPAVQGTTGSSKSYAVVATKPETDLSKHVNHKIEVTGTVTAPNSASKPSATPPSEAPAPVAAAHQTETLNVDSFKMVAMACP